MEATLPIKMNEAMILSILTTKGLQALKDGLPLCVYININKPRLDAICNNSFDAPYALKLHKRTLRGFLDTLYQTNGQVNTQVMKSLHIRVAIEQLIELGYIDEKQYKALFVKLNEKLDYLTDIIEKGWLWLVADLHNPDKLKTLLVVNYKGKVFLTSREEFETVVKDVKSGAWEGGCDQEKLKELRITKEQKKAKFYTKCGKKDGIVRLHSKAGDDCCTIFPSRNFNHKLFSSVHKGLTYEEVKSVVETKYHNDHDVEWFKQFETEVK